MGVVHQHVDATPLVDHPGDARFDLVAVLDVAREGQSLAADGGDLGRYRLALRHRPPEQRDPRAILGQREGDAAAHTLTGPGDDGDLAVQHTHLTAPSSVR